MTVLKLLQFIGAMSGGRTVTQVALAYLMGKGEPGKAIPLVKTLISCITCHSQKDLSLRVYWPTSHWNDGMKL